MSPLPFFPFTEVTRDKEEVARDEPSSGTYILVPNILRTNRCSLLRNRPCLFFFFFSLLEFLLRLLIIAVFWLNLDI